MADHENPTGPDEPRTTPAEPTVHEGQLEGQSEAQSEGRSESDSAEITRADGDTVPTRQASEKTLDGRRPHPGQPGQSEAEILPRTVGQYRLLEKLGEGGMGAVYLAEHERLRRPVALKMLTIERMRSAAALARFQREMAAAGQLSHPNIVVTHDAGDSDGVHYLAMELIDGVHLGELLQLGPLPVADACEIARQAALGLGYAHQCNLLHRDIKPSNLMLGRTRGTDGSSPDASDVSVKILDLGLARLDMTHEDDEELTAEGQMMGTIDYIAPEQADGGKVGRWSDIYSLGATLYKMLCGVAPYAESGKTLLEKLAALGRGPAPSIRTRVDLPSGLADLIDAMISPNPADRPASAEVVAQRLGDFAIGAELDERLRETEEAAASGRTRDARTWSVLRQRTPSSQAAPNTQSLPTTSVADTGMPTWQWITIGVVVAAIVLLLLQAPVMNWLNQDDSTINAGDKVIVAQGGPPVTAAPDTTATGEETTTDSVGMGVATTDGLRGTVNGPGGGIGTRNELEMSLGQPRQTPLSLPQNLQPPLSPRAAPRMSLPKSSDSPDSRIAFWFSSQGGQVKAASSPDGPSFDLEDPQANSDRYYIKSLDAKDKVAFSDANLPLLRELRQLEVAQFANTQITDAGLPAIAELTTLKQLDLSNTRVTSQGIKHLAPLKSLQVLRLRSTGIDDAAVPHLGRLTSLQVLDVSNTQVTEDGKAQLKKLLPKMKD